MSDIDKNKIRKVVRRTCAKRRKISLLKDVKIRNRFKETDIKLIDVVCQICGDISRIGL